MITPPTPDLKIYHLGFGVVPKQPIIPPDGIPVVLEIKLPLAHTGVALKQLVICELINPEINKNVNV